MDHIALQPSKIVWLVQSERPMPPQGFDKTHYPRLAHALDTLSPQAILAAQAAADRSAHAAPVVTQ